MSSDRASTVYGILNLLFAGLYLVLFLVIIPGRSGYGLAMALVLGGPAAAAGIGMLAISRPWGRPLATLSSLWLILACFLLILLLLSSAAYLHGIYSGVGQAGSAIGVIAALLAVEVVGLLPALQLAHLRRLKRAAKVSS